MRVLVVPLFLLRKTKILILWYLYAIFISKEEYVLP